jgi:hypothetical protein
MAVVAFRASSGSRHNDQPTFYLLRYAKSFVFSGIYVLPVIHLLEGRQMSFSNPEEALTGNYVIRDNGCWEWIRAKKSSGYGVQWFKGRLYPAHRLMWIALHGEPLPGYDICHWCNNKLCVNPEHLYQGTRTENMQQSVRQGRSGKKLSARDVTLIRALLKSIKPGIPAYRSNAIIGDQFGVSYKTVEFIAKGITYGSFYG